MSRAKNIAAIAPAPAGEKPPSRQLRSQRAAIAAGLCASVCGRKASKLGGIRCDACREKCAARTRARVGVKPWVPCGRGRPPIGKREEGRILRSKAIAKLTKTERLLLRLTPKDEREALRAAALAKLTAVEQHALGLHLLKAAQTR